MIAVRVTSSAVVVSMRAVRHLVRISRPTRRSCLGRRSVTSRRRTQDRWSCLWGLPRGTSPAGAINATPAQVLALAKLHLDDDDGVATDGTRVLSAESARVMREPQVEIPDTYTLGTHWGLGWILMSWDGHEFYGHDGGTLGQTAILRVCGEQK